ncbi:outer membrane protein [Luteibacter sp. 1214]|uniref:MipA/OmpV family protein n=1 Tax=Luteibacter sp. 1214 TaxID=2817735 RepID=UPI0028676AA8|nr:MipA/OmpV family protein [Luteibacter sp. 1214]MDR6641085.1 outer membrane protein [Luteibacter sp. 1214]
MSLPRFRSLPLVAVLAGVAVPAAHAQSSTDGQAHWTLGIGATWSPSPYRSYDNKAWPLPLVNYEGKSFYFRGASFGYRLYKTPNDEISVLVSPLANRFRHDDSNDARLRRLSDRDISGMGGIAWKHTADWGVLQASAQKEFTGHGGGTSLDANYAYPIRKGALTLTPTLGVTRANGALNDYYYGVSGREAARSGLASYRAGSGTAPWLGLAAMYRLSPSWITAAGMRYTVLPDAVNDSPMVGDDHTQSFFLSLSHVF